MAGFVERVQVVIDVVTEKSGAALKAFKDDIAGAEGAVGKLKAGIGSAASNLTSALGPAGIAGAAAAAGGALVAFGAKSVAAFQETALAAGKFHDATGLSVEDSSRWIAIADDIGVSAETLQGAFVKLEKQLGTNGQAFAQYGVEVVKAKDGSVDLNATLLNAIDAIQKIDDPTRKAAASAAIFGKGYAEVGELINTSSAEIVDSLKNVSEAQVIDTGELAKARDFRAAMDNLNDAVGDVQRSVGEDLVPALADAANGFAIAITKAQEFGIKLSVIPGVSNGDVFKAALGPFAVLGDLLGKNKSKAEELNPVVASLAGHLAETSGQMTKAELATKNAASTSGIATSQFGNFESRLAATGEAAAEADRKLQHLNETTLAGVDAAHGQHRAQQDVIDAQNALNEAQASGTATALELTIAQDSVVDSAIALATKNKEVETTAHGADAGNQAFSDTLQFIANNSSPEVKAQLQGVIDKLKTTGEQHPNPTVDATDNATAKITPVQTALTNISKHYTSTIDVGVNTGGANSALDALRNRLNTAAGQGVLINGRSGLHLTFDHGGLVPGAPGEAQAAVVHGGEYVLSQDVVQRIKRGQQSSGAKVSGGSALTGSGSSPVNVYLSGTFIGPDKASIGRWIDEALAASRRRGNRAG